MSQLCAGCGVELAGRRPQTKWCRDACRVRSYDRASPPRTYTCQVCGCSATQQGRGGPRKMCPACSTRWGKIERVRTIERYECLSCGAGFGRLPTKGQRPKWCPRCRLQSPLGSARKRHPDTYQAADQRRRARLAGVEVEKFNHVDVFERDGWRCFCGKKVDPRRRFPDPLSVSLDHVIPVSEGGGHTRANTRCSHLTCNVRRGAGGGGEQLRLVG